MLQTGDYAVIERGIDDIAAGHICRVLAPDEDEPNAFHRYTEDADEDVLVMCWTGFIGWTTPDNLIEVSGDNSRLERFFQLGFMTDDTRSL